MKSRTLVIVVGGVALLCTAGLVAYPMWLRSDAEDGARAEGCRADVPPGPRFYEAMRDDDRVAGFPGFGPSDSVAAEVAFCIGTFAQACLAAEARTEAERRETCERWRRFAAWYGRADHTRYASFDQASEALGRDGLCPVCPDLAR